MFKAVLIDIDDTLCLTEEACFNLENEVAVSMGFSPMTRAIHQKNWGKALEFAILERIPGIDADEFMKRVEQAIANKVYSGALDTISEENLHALEILKKVGIKLAIVTSRSFVEAKHLLQETHPINNLIDAFYHKDNSEFLKPDPRVFNQAFIKFNVKPEECVYLGDAINDAIAAKAAGMHFIAVLESGLKTKEDFAGYNVDYFTAKFADTTDYILNHD
jgi:HAD superfamily hydrolase (TIGR01662 family)